MSRFYSIPRWWRWFYPDAIWDFLNTDLAYDGNAAPVLFLTFDDGPHPETTPWLLDLLKSENIHATFFCLGENAVASPELIQQMREDGHALGHHTHSHANGFKMNKGQYLAEVKKGAKHIPSALFRPPYGRIRPSQFRAVKKHGFDVILWGHLSYDFDPTLSSEARITKIKKATVAGQIFVFHDSLKATPQLKKELPELLRFWKESGYVFSKIPVK